MDTNASTLLAIEVSPRSGYSVSRKLTDIYVKAWKAANPGGSVVVRDLIETNLPFVDPILASSARAGTNVETAIESAEVRDLAAAVAQVA